ncbi:DUF4097 family beta strand repeat-containing protein [Chryseolinea lacunae]|uniref:DUF4097 family beta strand repeat protein n=1 Tax=Chryseolinea lacunae TaxID=2801331 RepID=A0ABS1KZZ4_9BACT|nr:DUF4097 family beta strand repeat-containing protein [Chryseolinea lacunae]MBL0745031.1 DUF4097 family beta strand repeat protein [Chryseolinea lacunae]
MTLSIGFMQAQEYKVAKSSGRLEIREVNHVVVEGYSGNEIVFTSRSGKRDDDERAKGLRSVSANGLEDNTNLGLSVVDKGNVIEVQQLKRMDGPEITIKVPKGVTVSYSHTSPHGDEIEFKNVEGEIEVSTMHNGVQLTNVTGPLTIKTVHGDIEGTLNASVKAPISIVSVHGHVDIALPTTVKASVKLGTVYGEIFVDPEFKMDLERTENNMVKFSSDTVTGKINGGGLDINLSSTHNNVYLRKK